LPKDYLFTGNSFALDITTTATVESPITTCFNVSAVTDPAAFAQLRILHGENGKLIDRTSSEDFDLKMICASVSSLSPFVVASTPIPRMQILLEDGDPSRAAALDSELFLRDPFQVEMGANLPSLGVDRDTRVMLFVTNLELAHDESPSTVVVTIVDSDDKTHDVPAEDVRRVPGFDFTQVILKLPGNLHIGTCKVTVRAHGLISSAGTIRIRI
jgi:hypothetical protein